MRTALMFATLFGASQAQAWAQGPFVPNGTLSVAYRQLEQGKASDSVHQVELSCWDGKCSLSTVTLNQCLPSSDGLAFFPKVQRSSTADGDLRVRANRTGMLEAEEMMDGARFMYRFSYRERNDPALAKTLRLSSVRFFSGLTAFSGSVIKNSGELGKVISWDLSPFKGAFVFVEAKCKLMLNGVPE